MIITAQPFFNELDLLELKIRELRGVVDAHVVVESNRTFTGLHKRLYFDENKKRFEALGVPIIHRVVELPEVAESPWEREAAQYEHVRRVVREIKPKECIWCDADEIPRPKAILEFHWRELKTATLTMDHLLFGFDRVDATQRWRNAKIAWYDPAAFEQPWRGTVAPEINEGGWHCEYFGGKEKLLAKLNAVSHAPEEGCKNMRRLVEIGQLPGIERTAQYPRELLPAVVQENPGKWDEHFLAPHWRWTPPEGGNGNASA
jgi:beta-1,4-mannosyl-glycoprotein beta-1,4-N-acetylglucosaminyltransferase